jgi:hypothetical protein
LDRDKSEQRYDVVVVVDVDVVVVVVVATKHHECIYSDLL